jgi:hypothetical protein
VPPPPPPPRALRQRHGAWCLVSRVRSTAAMHEMPPRGQLAQHRHSQRTQWVAQPGFSRQIGIVAACWLSVVDLRRRIAASQKSDSSRDAGLNQSLE